MKNLIKAIEKLRGEHSDEIYYQIAINHVLELIQKTELPTEKEWCSCKMPIISAIYGR